MTLTLETLIPGRAREMFRSKRSADSSPASIATAISVPAPVPAEALEIVSVQKYNIDEKGNFKWIRDAEGNIVLDSRPVDRAIPVFDANDILPEPTPSTGLRGALARTRNLLARNVT